MTRTEEREIGAVSRRAGMCVIGVKIIIHYFEDFIIIYRGLTLQKKTRMTRKEIQSNLH